MADHRYAETWQEARVAYELVLRGADRAGVDVEASHNGWAVLPPVAEMTGVNTVVDYAAIDRFSGTKRALD
jgi:hypothetical protein